MSWIELVWTHGDWLRLGRRGWCCAAQDGLKNLVDNYRRFGKKIWLTECHGRLRFVPALEMQTLA